MNLNASTTSAVVNITVNNNSVPKVRITSASKGPNFISPATISINATASDLDGSITKVEKDHR